jgi:hypothetical protein
MADYGDIDFRMCALGTKKAVIPAFLMKLGRLSLQCLFLLFMLTWQVARILIDKTAADSRIPQNSLHEHADSLMDFP